MGEKRKVLSNFFLGGVIDSKRWLKELQIVPKIGGVPKKWLLLGVRRGEKKGGGEETGKNGDRDIFWGEEKGTKCFQM